jgi:hypothetical protein
VNVSTRPKDPHIELLRSGLQTITFLAMPILRLA